MIKNNEFYSKLININRISKVVKGGRRFSFSALVISGNKKGSIGYSLCKSKELPEAIKKASIKSKKKLYKFKLYKNRTIYHDTIGYYGSRKVIMKKSKFGSGIIAGGVMKHLFYLLGIKDIVAKSINNKNDINIIKATINGLKRFKI